MKPKDCTKNDIIALIDGVQPSDLLCKTILIKLNYDDYIREWITSENLFKKRAAFTLIASTSTHADLSFTEISGYLQLIERQRLLVKKAVS